MKLDGQGGYEHERILLMMFRKKGFYEIYVKKPQDCILALCTLIILLPFFIILSLIVWVKLGRPIFFKQNRPGLDEKIFTIYKFRTMTYATEENGSLKSDSDRLTKFGRFLRATSLDELPELWNIVIGDMSIVGPRPQLLEDVLFMTSEQRRRQTIKPGLTGWAQINGRNNITWEERLNFDLDYLNMISFKSDWMIIFNTVLKVIKKADISTEGMETSEDFGDYLLRTGKINIEEYNKRINSNLNIMK